MHDTRALIRGHTRTSVAIGKKFTTKLKWMLFCSTATTIIAGGASIIFQICSIVGLFKLADPAVNALAVSILHAYNLWVELSIKGVMSVISEQSKRDNSSKGSPNLSFEIENSARVSVGYDVPSRKPSIIRKHSIGGSNLRIPIVSAKDDDKHRQVLSSRGVEGNRSYSSSHKSSLNKSNKGSLNEVKTGSSKAEVSAQSLHKSSKEIPSSPELDISIARKPSPQQIDMAGNRRFSSKSIVSSDYDRNRESHTRKLSIKATGSREVSNSSSSKIESLVSGEIQSNGDLTNKTGLTVLENSVELSRRKLSIKSNHLRRFSNHNSADANELDTNPPIFPRKVSFKAQGTDVLLEENEVNTPKHERRSSKLLLISSMAKNNTKQHGLQDRMEAQKTD
ncbi:hypothetical protein HK103_003990 [Boothiomyces macroporosus]|uniref:Uncharacterized protein n=1 Tax=Boothiomyces macroporosus TaxID=261099 RepID=A0AAD5UHC6_9FUNG|nr:hypothetical protein HK103_003990 [Boothiomyces macroporosus]